MLPRPTPHSLVPSLTFDNPRSSASGIDRYDAEDIAECKKLAEERHATFAEAGLLDAKGNPKVNMGNLPKNPQHRRLINEWRVGDADNAYGAKVDHLFASILKKGGNHTGIRVSPPSRGFLLVSLPALQRH